MNRATQCCFILVPAWNGVWIIERRHATNHNQPHIGIGICVKNFPHGCAFPHPVMRRRSSISAQNPPSPDGKSLTLRFSPWLALPRLQLVFYMAFATKPYRALQNNRSLLPPNPRNINCRQNKQQQLHPPRVKDTRPCRTDNDPQRNHRPLEETPLPPFQREWFEDIHVIKASAIFLRVKPYRVLCRNRAQRQLSALYSQKLSALSCIGAVSPGVFSYHATCSQPVEYQIQSYLL